LTHEFIHEVTGLKDTFKTLSEDAKKIGANDETEIYLFPGSTDYWYHDSAKRVVPIGQYPSFSEKDYMNHTDTVAAFIDGFCDP